jgi:RHS repeat-associated protein
VGTGATNQPNFTYSYDRFGNLETITDAGAPNTFVYDLQNRLTTAYGESYSYDGVGRLTNYEGTPLIAFGAYGRRTTSAVYTDDAVGNLTGRLSETGVAQTLKWSHENRLVEVKSSNLLTETYGYDEAGQRVKRTTVAKVGAGNVTTTTYYIGAGQEVQNCVPVRYYSLGGNTLGVRQGASVSWLYGDHLGSTSASSGAAATSERYYAYGKDRGTGNLPTDHRFTGQISDASGLIFMNARYYDPVLGSFISPDTLVPEPGQPEGYNRYAYANGNPLLFSDPSGHIAICFQGGTGAEVDNESAAIQMCTESLNAGGYVPANHGAIFYAAANSSKDYDNAYWAAVEASKNGEPILIAGYSWGGPPAISLAQQLNEGFKGTIIRNDGGHQYALDITINKNISVDLLVTIDSVGFMRFAASTGLNSPSTQESIPQNVRSSINIYAAAAEWAEGTHANGTNHLEGAQNTAVDDATHYTILDLNDERHPWSLFGGDEPGVELNLITVSLFADAIQAAIIR